MHLLYKPHCAPIRWMIVLVIIGLLTPLGIGKAYAQSTGGAVAPASVYNTQIKAGVSWSVNEKRKKVLRLGNIIAFRFDGTIFDYCDVICTVPIVRSGKGKSSLFSLVFETGKALNRAKVTYRGAGRSKTYRWNGDNIPYSTYKRIDGAIVKAHITRFKVRYNDATTAQVPRHHNCRKIRCPRW
jgi:hypothetical protein